MFHLHIIKPLRHTGKWQHRVREWKQKSIKYKEGGGKSNSLCDNNLQSCALRFWQPVNSFNSTLIKKKKKVSALSLFSED